MENINQNITQTLFIPPQTNTYTQWGETILILFFIFCIFVAILILYIYVNKNDYQNKISVISSAHLFGEDPQKKFENYIKNAQSQAITNANSDIYNKNDQINTVANRLQNNTDRLSSKIVNDAASNSNVSNNLGIIMQKNITLLKDTMQKMAGVFMLNTYISDGAIKTVNSVNGSSLNTLVKSISDVNDAKMGPTSAPTPTPNPLELARLLNVA